MAEASCAGCDSVSSAFCGLRERSIHPLVLLLCLLSWAVLCLFRVFFLAHLAELVEHLLGAAGKALLVGSGMVMRRRFFSSCSASSPTGSAGKVACSGSGSFPSDRENEKLVCRVRQNGQTAEERAHHGRHGELGGPAQHFGQPGLAAHGEACLHHLADAVVAEAVGERCGMPALRLCGSCCGGAWVGSQITSRMTDRMRTSTSSSVVASELRSGSGW